MQAGFVWARPTLFSRNFLPFFPSPPAFRLCSRGAFGAIVRCACSVLQKFGESGGLVGCSEVTMNHG
jgi:hypothetical protein